MHRGTAWIVAWISCLAAASACAQVLWKEPPPMTAQEWSRGPWGAELVPHPPYRFVSENMNGTNAKVNVRDAEGRTWVVKLGGEVHADTFAARLSYALGYAASPTYFVAKGVIEDAHGLKRAGRFIAKDGSFHTARFKLKQSHKEPWSWVDNPFAGSRELGGLKVLVMLLSNWDTKDSRDGDGSNNSVFEKFRPDGVRQWYAVTDWGASMGKTGNLLQWERWDWRGYRAQSRGFVKLRADGTLRWGFAGKHGRDITAGVDVEDIRWLLPLLARITDNDLIAALQASGASPAVAGHFTYSIRRRVQQLQNVAASSMTADVRTP